MSTAVAPRNGTAPAQQQSTSVAARVIDAVNGTQTFATLLPAIYRPFADRFLARAKLYISRRPELQQCTVPSLAQCVLSAAQDGLCLDGRMAHAVAFNNKKKGADGRDLMENGKPVWVKEATYMPDYKGIVDTCRRHNSIVDAYAEHVYENDEFRYFLENGRYQFRWEPSKGDRGEYLGSFCCVVLPGERFKIVYMSEAEIDHIRNKSKAKDSGPWVTDKGEMQKKTVTKRALKLYVTDPDTADLMDRDDEAMGYVDDGKPIAIAAPAKSLDEHAARQIAHTPSQPLDMPGYDDAPAYEMDEPPTITEQRQEQQPEPAAETFDSLLMKLPFAKTIIEANEIEAAANKLAKSEGDQADLALAHKQAFDRIQGSRGPRTNKGKGELFTGPDDGSASYPK